jgi:hypothetical protein
MSYTSESILPNTTSLVRVQDVVTLLGYRKVHDGLKVPNRVAAYAWFEEQDYRSHVGVELDIYRDPNGDITVTTRSGIGRSYWDLSQQNKTLKILRDLLGGHFITDAGRNRYWRPDEPPPSPLSSGCLLARWRFHDGLGRARIYLMTRKFEGQIARDTSSGFGFLDDVNPHLLSNNLLLPYLVAVWEEYFRAMFTACLKYSGERESAFKRARLNPEDLEKVVIGSQPIERAIAESYSFQRPSVIRENFRLLDQKLDIGSALRKPYEDRKTSLFDSIEHFVEDRNSFVHTGRMNCEFFDEQLYSALSDMEVAVDRVYECVAAHYGFNPTHNF